MIEFVIKFGIKFMQLQSNQLKSVFKPVKYYVSNEIWSQLMRELECSIIHQVHSQVHNQVRGQVYDRVCHQVRNQVYAITK
jgi:hypothetical protein